MNLNFISVPFVNWVCALCIFLITSWLCYLLLRIGDRINEWRNQ